MKKMIFITVLFGFTALSYADANLKSALNANDQQQLARRVFMLEYALAPSDPQQLAQQWARAVKTRNGAVQYMLFCPGLQKKYLNQLEQLNWVTGASSPHITSFQVQSNNNNGFKVTYTFSPALVRTIDEFKVTKVPSDQNSSQQWCIAQLRSTTTPLKVNTQ